MSRNSYAGEHLLPPRTPISDHRSSPKAPTSNNIISSFLNAFRRKGANSPESNAPRSEDDFRSLPPRSSNGSLSQRSSNHNKKSQMPQLEALAGRDGFDRPNLTTSISEPNGFVSVGLRMIGCVFVCRCALSVRYVFINIPNF